MLWFITFVSLSLVCLGYEQGGGGRLLFPDPRKSRMGHHVIDNMGNDDQLCGRRAFQVAQAPTTVIAGETQVSFEIRNGGEVTIGSGAIPFLTTSYSKKGTYTVSIPLDVSVSVISFRFKSKYGGTYWSCADVEVVSPKVVNAAKGVEPFVVSAPVDFFELAADGDRTQRVLVGVAPVAANEYCGVEIWRHSLSPSLGGLLLHNSGGHFVSGAYVTVAKYTKLFVRIIHKSDTQKLSGCSVTTTPVTSKSIVLHEADSEVSVGKAEPLRVGHHANGTHSCLISSHEPDCVMVGGTDVHRIDLGDHFLTSPAVGMSRGVQTLQTEDPDCILLEKDVAHQVTLNTDSSAYRFHYDIEEEHLSYVQLLWYTSPLTAFHHPDSTSNVSVTVLYTHMDKAACPNNTYIYDYGFTEYGRWSGLSLPYGPDQNKTVAAGRYCVLVQLLNPETDGQNVDIWYRTGPEGLHTGGVGLHATTGLEVSKTNTTLHGETARLTFHAARSRSPITYEVFVSKDKALFRMPEQVTDELVSVANLSSHSKPWKKKLTIDIPSDALVPSSDGVCMFYQIVVSARNTDGDHMIYAPYSYYPGDCLLPDQLQADTESSDVTGIVVGVLVAVVLLAALLVGGRCYLRRRNGKSERQKSPPSPLEETALQPPPFQMDADDMAASSVVSTDAPATEPTEVATAANALSTNGHPSSLDFSNPTSQASSPSSVRPQAPMLQETPYGASSELADRLRRQREKLDS